MWISCLTLIQMFVCHPLIRVTEWVLNDEKTVKWQWNEEEKNLRGWPLFKILPRGSVYPSFKIGFIQSKVTISWSLVGGIRFFSFILIKNDGMSPEWEWKNQSLSKIFLILSSFNEYKNKRKLDTPASL